MTPEGTSRSYRLPKQAILRHKRGFEYLFEHGSSFRVGVLKFFYAYKVPGADTKAPITVGFTAPKRVFKRAWQRNRIKRRMREAYRLQQSLLEIAASDEASSLPLAFLIKFQGYYEADYQRIENDMRRGLLELKKRSR